MMSLQSLWMLTLTSPSLLLNIGQVARDLPNQKLERNLNNNNNNNNNNDDDDNNHHLVNNITEILKVCLV